MKTTIINILNLIVIFSIYYAIGINLSVFTDIDTAFIASGILVLIIIIPLGLIDLVAEIFKS
jgi:hypothetical protein